MTLVFLDLETTGTDPDAHHVWEVAAIVRGHRDRRYDGLWHVMMRPRLAAADPAALRVGRYYERATAYLSDPDVQAHVVDRPLEMHPFVPIGRAVTRLDVARWLAVILDGATLIGATPSFDANFMARFLRSHWQAPTWHHRLVDVTTLAAGYLAGHRDGYNTSARWLVDAHHGASGGGCALADPELDTSAVPGPPWRSTDLAARLGVVGEPEARHTAVGDARWAMAVYDQVAGT
ncbi:hypothetical protein GA0074692_6756 [Micromonospora pallida]|uniref:Exonuclease n=1 Tax=Micromonospora pallida TaxID=145854 RepID=A0A1C6TN57_9ACTN|nr:hypothetical protein [Micromonospora pallida]SCL43191.1 hypothetical protein GA0074692_6756 [Micromonospora pallida]